MSSPAHRWTFGYCDELGEEKTASGVEHLFLGHDTIESLALTV
jgi:hypothetical protein